MPSAISSHFAVKPAFAVKGVTQIASRIQPAVAKTLRPKIHVPLGAEELQAQWLEFFDKAKLWAAPEVITSYEMRNAIILGRSCIVMAEDYALVRESIQKPTRLRDLHPYLLDHEVDLGRFSA